MPTVSWQSASGAALALAALLWAWRSRARRHEAENATGKVGAWDYGELVKTVRSEGLAMPAMLVLLPAFDRNAARLAAVARAAGKTIRLGTKSLRVPELIFRALASSDVFQGVLCFSVEEAALLYGLRPECRDLLVAYPTVSREDVRCAMRLTQQGARVTLMVDSLEHVALLAQLVPELRREASLSAETRLRVCIDVDMSSSLLGLHLGVQRSPIRSVEQFEAVLEAVLARKESLFLCGVMVAIALAACLSRARPSLMQRACVLSLSVSPCFSIALLITRRRGTRRTWPGCPTHCRLRAPSTCSSASSSGSSAPTCEASASASRWL